MKWLVLAIALSACGGDKTDKPEADPKKTACDAAIERGVTMTLERRQAMGKGSPNMQKLVDELGPKLKGALAKLCIDDHWADSVVSCFQTASDIASCKEALTAEQRSKYTQAMMQVMMGQGGMMRGPGHGSGLPPAMRPPAESGSGSSQ